MALTTVIVPAYNAASYLMDCVASVIGQTCADWELVIIDDGSTDGSAELCDAMALKDSRIRVRHTENRGVSSARNLGLDMAQGLWCVFLDADDMIHPLMLETLHAVARQTGSPLVACDMQHDDAPNWQPVDSNKLKPRHYTSEQAIADTLYQRSINCSCSGKMYRTEVLRQAGGFKPGIRFEDLESFHRFFAVAQDIVSIPTPLYYYRPNPKSYINTWSPERLDVLTVTEELERHYAQKTGLSRAARDRRFSANYNIMLLCMRYGQETQARQCWSQIRRLRREVLLNRHSRLKNKMGALISLCGYHTLKILFGRGKKA